MALVIALALMTGLQGELRDRILGSNRAHLRLEDAAASPTTAPKSTKLRSVPHVVGAAPAILGQGADRRRRGDQAFISIKGIDPALEPQVTDIAARDAAAAASTRSTPPTATSPTASCSARISPRKLGVDGRRLGVAC